LTLPKFEIYSYSGHIVFFEIVICKPNNKKYRHIRNLWHLWHFKCTILQKQMRDDFLELLRLVKWKSEVVNILIKFYVDVEWASYYNPREYDDCKFIPKNFGIYFQANGPYSKCGTSKFLIFIRCFRSEQIRPTCP